MKTAVSIPDDVYREAESLARRLNLSRSGLYAKALREFVDRHDPDAIVELINRVVEDLGEPAVDPAWQAQAVRRLRDVEWEDAK